MARESNRLTALTVRNVSKPGMKSDGNGLYLAVRSGGSKQWAFIYRRDGRLREMGLGSPTFGAYALALVGRIGEGFSNAKHRQQWRKTVEFYCEPIWHLPMGRYSFAKN